MKIEQKLIIAFVVIAVNNVTLAGELQEMNVRQTIDNTRMNKIISLRLQGLLAGKAASQNLSSFSENDRENCSLQIGGHDGSQSALGSDQEIIVIGDVINYCK